MFWIDFGNVFLGFLFFFVVMLISFVFWNEKLIVIKVNKIVSILFGKRFVFWVKCERNGVGFFFLKLIKLKIVVFLIKINRIIVVILIFEN